MYLDEALAVLLMYPEPAGLSHRDLALWQEARAEVRKAAERCLADRRKREER